MVREKKNKTSHDDENVRWFDKQMKQKAIISYCPQKGRIDSTAQLMVMFPFYVFFNLFFQYFVMFLYFVSSFQN